MTLASRSLRSGSLALATVTLVALGMVAGCGAGEKARDKAESAGEGALERAITEGEYGEDVEDVDVDAESGTITIRGKDGTLLIGEDLAMPDGFPRTLPLPEGGHSINAVVAERGVFEVTMLVTDTDLVAHEKRIRAGLTRAGYEIEATEQATVDGVEQRVVNGVGHDTEIAVRFSSPLGKAAVHYSVKAHS